MKMWKEAMSMLETELTSVTFKTWFSPLKPSKYVSGVFYLEAPNAFYKEMVDTRYSALIKNALSMIDPSVQSVKLLVESEETEPPEKQTSQPSGELPEKVSGLLNPRYSFEHFVIGENNRFAHAASVAVAESPSKKYNPLFIYGGVGLGKTHLMQAIGNYVAEYNKNRKVIYISCEGFTNEYINSIMNNTNPQFREKYRNTDLLLIDDIQFLTGKEETQEAFFHTFNELYENDKQIVITSDRPPKEIQKLTERLRSRFEMGLITDISAPNFETRMAILRKKAESYDGDISDDILSYIAENIHSNIRELEGALTTVTAYAKLHGKPVTLATAKEAMKDLLHTESIVIDIPYIKETTAKFFDVDAGELDSKKRTKKVTQPRQVAMYLCRELTDNSFPKIGEAFGGRDHSTVVHACQKISEELSKESEFSRLVLMIRKEITRED